jgi:AraC family transcriptional regulator of adaptative response/methylated-DNA-[protein]-cysteine methyltransferase
MMTAAALEMAPRVGSIEVERQERVDRRLPSRTDPFVYGVRSTRIYCRPDCPSRRPAPGQIVFFDSPPEAVASGFRACRRCRPERGLGYSPQLEAVEAACRLLGSSVGDPIDLSKLSRQVGYSPSHLQRVFTGLLGISPKQYRNAVRSGAFRAELRRGRSVRASTYAAGRRSLSWPYSEPTDVLGMGAREFREGGRDVPIHYQTRQTAVGRILVAATARGICHVGLGGSEDELRANLRTEFPNASLKDFAPGRLARWADQIAGSLDRGRLPLSDLPLDIRATTFQARVWRSIRTIPRGRTRTYREVAEQAGYPGSARAVARACATNPTALLIPCHRVIRADRGPGGYRWGITRKIALLSSEGHAPKSRDMELSDVLAPASTSEGTPPPRRTSRSRSTGDRR